jgi:hypothetical protein
MPVKVQMKMPQRWVPMSTDNRNAWISAARSGEAQAPAARFRSYRVTLCMALRRHMKNRGPIRKTMEGAKQGFGGR